MPDITSGNYGYGPFLNNDQEKEQDQKGSTKSKVNNQAADASNNPYGGFANANAYNEWLQSQYGVQAFGRPTNGGKNRQENFGGLNIPALAGAFYDPYNPIGSLAIEGYENYQQGAAEQFPSQNREIWNNPFGDPYGGVEESRLRPADIGAARWTPELQKAINEAYWGLNNTDASYNVGVAETGAADYGGSGNYYNYYPRYRYGNYETAKSWYNNMLNWKI